MHDATARRARTARLLPAIAAAAAMFIGGYFGFPEYKTAAYLAGIDRQVAMAAVAQGRDPAEAVAAVHRTARQLYDAGAR
jgi:hypothetical protein